MFKFMRGFFVSSKAYEHEDWVKVTVKEYKPGWFGLLTVESKIFDNENIAVLYYDKMRSNGYIVSWEEVTKKDLR